MEKRKILPALFTTALLSLGLVVVSTPAKTEVVKAEGASYVKVTEAPTDWTGQYLIVSESSNVALKGSATTLDAGDGANKIDVTINSGVIECNETTQANQFTITKNGSDYNIQSASGYYIGNTSNANKLYSNKTTKYANTISMNADKSVNIISAGSYLRWNSSTASGNLRFRYYKSSSYTSQKAIQLYKLVEEESGETVQLGTTSISMNYDGTASWSSVVHASEYKYIINDGEAQTTTETSVKINDGDTIKVQAIGDGEKYLDGEWSEVASYTKSDYYLTIAQALEKAPTTHNTYTDSKYIVTGVIKNIENTQYGNMTIEDETGSLYIYGVYSADGSVRYDAMKKGVKPVVGDTVTLLGVLGSYSNKKQMKNSWMIDMESTHPHTGSFKHNEEGHWKECTHCGAKFEEASHTYTETVTAPTCTDKGYTTHACECGYSYQDTEVAELGHAYGEATYAWNEDYTSCTATRTCSADETHVETETVEATVETVESTCGAAGSKTYVATFENSAFAEQTHKEDLEIAAHTWGEATYSWNEDHTECTATRTCTADETHVETETVKATVETVESTCKVAGSKTYTVAFTNEAFAAQTHTEELALAEHAYDEGVVTTEPTQEQEGVKTFTCGGCGHTYTEAIAKLPATSEEPSEEPSTEPSTEPSDEPTEEPTEPTKKGCKGSTAGLIGLVTLAGALLLSKKRK